MIVIGFLKVIAWALGTALAGLGIFELLHVARHRKSEPISYGIASAAAPAGARLAQNRRDR